MNKQEIFRNKNGEAFELFYDLSYYDMWCVRKLDEEDFSFHFSTFEFANKFKSLIRQSY